MGGRAGPAGRRRASSTWLAKTARGPVRGYRRRDRGRFPRGWPPAASRARRMSERLCGPRPSATAPVYDDADVDPAIVARSVERLDDFDAFVGDVDRWLQATGQGPRRRDRILVCRKPCSGDVIPSLAENGAHSESCAVERARRTSKSRRDRSRCGDRLLVKGRRTARSLPSAIGRRAGSGSQGTGARGRGGSGSGARQVAHRSVRGSRDALATPWNRKAIRSRVVPVLPRVTGSAGGAACAKKMSGGVLALRHRRGSLGLLAARSSSGSSS